MLRFGQELFLSYLDVHWKGLEIRHHILIKKWKPGFLPMVCYNSVIPSKVSGRNSLNLHLHLIYEALPAKFSEKEKNIKVLIKSH